MPFPLTILLQEPLAPPLESRLRALCPEWSVLTLGDIQARPGLLATVNVIYGHLKQEEWPRARALRWVQLPWVGPDYMLTPQFRATGAALYKAEGVNAHCIAESMFGMVLAHTRGLAGMWAAQQRQEWVPEALQAHQQTLEGKILGLLGVGHIGGHAAGIGRAFGMRVLGCRRGGAPHAAVDEMFAPPDRIELCRRADVIMNSMPLTDTTRGFLGTAEFEAMKPGAILAVFGRSRTVDTAAMIEALRRGKLGAALLDVFDEEPLPKGHPLWTMPNVYISPHCAGQYPGRRERSDEMFLENAERYRDGEPLQWAVDLDAGY